MASFSQFGSDLDENTQLQIKRGVVLNEVLKQERFSPLTMAAEVILLYCATSDKFNFLATEDITEFYTALFADIRLRHPNIFEEITDGKVFTDEIKSEIDSAYEEYKETFLAEHEEYVEDY
jgi:F-type H+-transporting ATPase subunit alpha